VEGAAHGEPRRALANLPRLRSYRVTVETEKGAAPADVIVGDILAALEGIPGVVDPAATRDAEGVLSATFTVLETDMGRAGTRASELFREAAQRAEVDAQWRVIETDEGPPVGQPE
jgi:hypothetical protein